MRRTGLRRSCDRPAERGQEDPEAVSFAHGPHGWLARGEGHGLRRVLGKPLCGLKMDGAGGVVRSGVQGLFKRDLPPFALVEHGSPGKNGICKENGGTAMRLSVSIFCIAGMLLTNG